MCGVVVMSFGMTFRAYLSCDWLAADPGDFDRHDAGGDDDHAVTQNHDQRGHGFAQRRLWRDIAVANGRNRDDGPVHALRNRREAVLPLRRIAMAARSARD